MKLTLSWLKDRRPAVFFAVCAALFDDPETVLDPGPAGYVAPHWDSDSSWPGEYHVPHEAVHVPR